jgi:NADPH-dependent 7-cyano-7-deazaguanine reductase QueF
LSFRDDFLVWGRFVLPQYMKGSYAKRKSFHEQVADQIIQSVVKKRKISLLDLDESELSDFCPDSDTT